MGCRANARLGKPVRATIGNNYTGPDLLAAHFCLHHLHVPLTFPLFIPLVYNLFAGFFTKRKRFLSGSRTRGCPFCGLKGMLKPCGRAQCNDAWLVGFVY